MLSYTCENAFCSKLYLGPHYKNALKCVILLIHFVFSFFLSSPHSLSWWVNIWIYLFKFSCLILHSSTLLNKIAGFIEGCLAVHSHPETWKWHRFLQEGSDLHDHRYKLLSDHLWNTSFSHFLSMTTITIANISKSSSVLRLSFITQWKSRDGCR